MQAVKTEQEYMDVLIYSKPSTPDRTAYITGKSNANPLTSMLKAAQTLVDAGVSCIAMPCVTAHFFYEDLAQAVAVPFINIMDETAKHVRERGFVKVGLLATDGTLQSQMFHKAFAKHGIDVVVPVMEAQNHLSDVIYRIKCGEMPVNAIDSISSGLYDAGAEAIILGCTELGLLEKSNDYIYIEAMEALAHAALLAKTQTNEINI